MIFHERTSLLFSFFWLDLFPISDSFLLVLGIDNSFLFEIKLFKAITTKEKAEKGFHSKSGNTDSAQIHTGTFYQTIPDTGTPPDKRF